MIVAGPRPGGSPVAALEVLEAQASALTSCAAWAALEAHARDIRGQQLRALVDLPGRYAGFSRSAGPVVLDFSRQRMSSDTLALLLRLAEERSLPAWRDNLFAGARVNNTERRPALHMALRNSSNRPVMVDGVDVMPLVREELERVLRLADALGSGDYKGHTGRAISDVVNIGIGGSDLGLVMADGGAARIPESTATRPLRFNIDGTQLADALDTAPGAHALHHLLEELHDARDATQRGCRPPVAAAGLPEAAVARHFVAVSVNDPAMDRFGIAPGQSLPNLGLGRRALFALVGGRAADRDRARLAEFPGAARWRPRAR